MWDGERNVLGAVINTFKHIRLSINFKKKETYSYRKHIGKNSKPLRLFIIIVITVGKLDSLWWTIETNCGRKLRTFLWNEKIYIHQWERYYTYTSDGQINGSKIAHLHKIRLLCNHSILSIGKSAVDDRCCERNVWTSQAS